jgi:hypothetical protein
MPTTHAPTYGLTFKDLELLNDLPIDLKNSIWITKEELEVYEYPLKSLVGKWHSWNKPVNYKSPFLDRYKPKTSTNKYRPEKHFYDKNTASRQMCRLKATRDSLDTPSCIKSIITRIIKDKESDTEASSDTISSIHSKESTPQGRILSDYEAGIGSPDYIHVNSTDMDSKSSHL